MDMSKVIDEAKKALDVESDYALAKKLDIPNPRISEYRSGKARPDAYACARLAEVLGMDPFELLAQVEAATEKNEGRRAYWTKVAAKMATTSLAVFFVLAVLPETSKAAQNIVKDQDVTVFRSYGAP
ncbi:MAG: helix-turn-helix domain-containing protein [Proteobacteria bacterium]|nr:helix-turn-helix domain-containing protein [Pseudomonadota bacterium]